MSPYVINRIHTAFETRVWEKYPVDSDEIYMLLTIFSHNGVGHLVNFELFGDSRKGTPHRKYILDTLIRLKNDFLIYQQWREKECIFYHYHEALPDAIIAYKSGL